MTRKFIIVIFMWFFSNNSFATSYPIWTFEELINNSELIITGAITKVDMIDYKGNQVTDPTAMPGLTKYELDNTLQFHIKVNEVLFNYDTKHLNRNIIVKLSARRLRLDYAQEDYIGKKGLFLLKKKRNFSLTSGAIIIKPLEDKTKVLIHLFCKKYVC